MINNDNLKDLLKALNFEEEGYVFSKYFPYAEAYLKVDFQKREIIYPTNKGLKVTSETTSNFTADENFVVLECVNRLLEKGYKPEHIELEPTWKVGHGASGGRGDILIKDNSGKPLLIIECKKEGNEFKKEWNNTLQRGGQMLTYAKQAGSTQFICLYASDFVDGKVIPIYHVISLNDNKKLLEELKDQKPLSFAEAKGLEVEDIYKAWKDTYRLDFATKGIFEDDIQAYQIGKQKYTINDLEEVGSKDIQSKYHEFATILRQHNVSGRENAFDKLVNLFLCKIVDESKNPNDLKFYWKGIAYDSYFDLQDRLQLLYQAGMKEFLGEDVTYIDNASIDKAFRFFKKDPDATRETIKKYFRQLKFFTNNDFAFIDVHNEKLFYQNSTVLLKIVQMLQDTRLQSETQNQFLGDMFEGFLDQGVKQSEGQFFTPMPIVKFILNSLPLESIIKDSELPPKAIDYACGAGHFLNELALQIKPFVKQHKETDIKEYYKEIVGIEKEYRLSKVAKVSAFMYGQDEIKITYADALGKNAKLEEGGYSILVANPPYSVKGFLQTLTEEERKAFELINTVDEKSLASNNSIETFFIERAKQLLKPGGVAGIILPSSILSNDSNIYSATREILIKYFDIVSIVEFGSQTFGKTGTNTVTLFLRRKEDNPAPAEHWQNRVEAWFSNNEAEAIYSDSNHIANYCNHVGIDPSHYRTLLTGNPNDILLATEVFIEYRKAFDKLAEIKNLVKQRTFKAKPKDEQEIELRRRFVEYLYVKEKDKLYYFVLASENKQKVLVVKYGSKTKEQKQFIGYSWSSAKGKEGIKYLSTAEIVEDDEEERENNDVGLSFDDKESLRILKNLNSILYIQTPLYNPINRHDTTKINYFIEQNFFGNELPIDDHLSSYMAYYQLTDMFDFSRKNFNKQISLTSKKTATIETKWEIAKLGDVVDVSIGGTPARENGAYFGGKNLWVSISEMKGQVIFDTKEKITNVGVNKSNVKLIPKGTTLLSFKLSIGKTAVAGEDLYTNEAIAGLIPRDKGKLLDSYLFNLFNAKQIDLESTGLKAFGKSLNSDFLKNDVKIPLPPKEIQAQIVAECKIVDIEVSNAEKEIEKMQRGIEKSIQNEYSKKYPMDKISNLSLVNPSKTEIRNINDDTLVSFVEMASVSESGFISNSVDKRLKDLRKGSYTYFKEGDVIIAKITPCMENGKCAVSNGLTNEIGMGSSEFHVIRTSEKIINKYLFALLNSEEVRKEAEKKMTGASGHRRVPASFYENYRIPVPPLNDQMKLVAEIEKLEQIIKTEQIKIDTSADKKKEIMKKYL